MEYIYGQTLKRGSFPTRWPFWGEDGQDEGRHTGLRVCVSRQHWIPRPWAVESGNGKPSLEHSSTHLTQPFLILSR